MARLDLDFCTPSRRPDARTIVLLLLGALIFSWVVDQWMGLKDSETGLQYAITQLSQRPSVKRQVLPADSPAKMARERVTAHLTASWQPPLAALAAIHGGAVALVSLDANQSKRQLKLVAEARRLADVVSFIEALQQQPGIKRAVLTQHEFQRDVDQQPVRFHVTLEWRA